MPTASKHLYSPLLINIQVISMIVITHKGRLPEKLIRPKIAGRLAKKF